MGICIRSPKPEEWPACRMLVPEPFQRRIQPEILLAVEGSAGAILGAIAFQHGMGRTNLFRLRVVAPRRREGIGRALVEEVFLAARARCSAALATLADTKKDPDAEAFLLSVGFTHSERLFTVEADVDTMLTGVTGLRERLVRSGRVPATAHFVSLAKAPKTAVALLYDRHILAETHMYPGYLEASLTDRRLQRLSVVAMDQDRVAGILIAEGDGELATVAARVVAPEYRGGWVNVLIMAAALEGGRAAGMRRVQFDSLAGGGDTLKLARRYGAEVTRVRDSFHRQVCSGE